MLRQARADVLAASVLSRPLGICAIAVALLVLGTTIARTTESWEVLLRHQLQEQQRCTLDKVLMVREVPVGNIVGLEGRIRCADTREFDFKRERENERFTIRLCEPVNVC